MAYTFDAVFAVDPNNPANVAKNATITIFDPADPTQAPIAITDPTGMPLPNPITVDAAGMGPAYQHPTLARVGWKGAGFVGYFTSYEGMFNETQAAKTAAQAAVSEATAAASERVTAATVTGGKLILTKATGVTVDAGSVIGPPGTKGDKGADGANVLPTQQAVAQAIADRTYTTRNGLHRFRAALEANNVNIIACGDSWTEGTRGADAPHLRFVDHLATAIRSRATNPEGGFYFPAWATYPTRLPATWSYTGTVTNRDYMGLGFYNVEMAVGAVATLTYKGTGVRLYIGKASNGATLEIRIDGALMETVNTTNASTDSTFYRTYLGLTPKSHTVTVTVIAGTGTIGHLMGAYMYNGDDASGVRFYPSGRGGIKSDFMTAQHFGGQLTATVPDLVLLEFGINDYRNGIQPSVVKANYLAGINAVRSRTPIADASIVIVSPPEPVIAAIPAVAPWSAYKQAIKEAADESGVLLLDLNAVFGDGILVAADPLVNDDRVHPDDPGHRAIASFIADNILPSVTIRKTGREQVFVPANQFILNGGTPAMDSTNGTFAAWKLDQAASESVLANINPPVGWTSYDIDLWFYNPNVSTGDFRVFCRVGEIPFNGPAASPVGTTKTLAAGGQFVTSVSIGHHAGVTIQSGSLMRLMVERQAADALDTLANDVGFIGAMLRRVS